MYLTHLLFLALTAGSTEPSVVVTTSAVDAGMSPHEQALAEYPQRFSDRPITIGAGLFQLQAIGSYSFFTADELKSGQTGGDNLGAIPDIRYGVSDPLELVLLGIRYRLADDGQNFPGVAVRIQLHDLAWLPQIKQYANLPYPILRPGIFLDFRDRLPAHFTAVGSVGYVVSIVVGDYTDGSGPIPKGQNVATQTAPFLLGLEYSPWDLFSFIATGGFLLDATSIPQNPSMTDITASLAVAWTPTNRFDLRVFFRNNWFQNSYGYVPELGLAFSLRL